jgi:hypothetical protein
MESCQRDPLYRTRGFGVERTFAMHDPMGIAIDRRSRLSICLRSSVGFAELENANDDGHQGQY